MSLENCAFCLPFVLCMISIARNDIVPFIEADLVTNNYEINYRTISDLVVWQHSNNSKMSFSAHVLVIDDMHRYCRFEGMELIYVNLSTECNLDRQNSL
jgi:hypothetical protein